MMQDRAIVNIEL